MNPENFLEFARVLPEPLLLLTAEGKILAFNPAVRKILGLNSKELQGKMLFDLVTEADEKVIDYLRVCSRTREMVLGSLTFRKYDGETLSCRCEGAVVQTRSSDAPAMNILRLKKRTSANSNFILLNQKIKELTEEAHRRKQAQETLSKTNEVLKQTLDDLERTQIQLAQTEKMSSLGKLVAGIAHEINNPINFINGNITHSSNYIQDLLELVQLYQQEYPHPSISIQEKIAAINLDFLQEDLNKVFYSMKTGTDRILEIVKSLRNFSRVDQAEIKKVDIHEGIDNTLVILQHRLKRRPVREGDTQYPHPGVEIVKEYGEVPLVYCYPSQLNQVFMNILSNAIDALDELLIITHQSLVNSTQNNTQLRKNDMNALQETYRRLKEKTNPQIRIRTEVIDRDWLIIKIADNGIGMTQEIRQRIFDPFFTTKAVGKGTGIGLYISYQIVVDKHGGQLNCFSQPGQGSEFIIEIPTQPKLLF